MSIGDSRALERRTRPPDGHELEVLAEAVRFPLGDILHPLPLHALFSAHQPLEVDLGCGDGMFLAGEAARRPNHNFLGVERQRARVIRSCRRCARARLMNARVVLVESSYFVRYLLPAHSVAVLHVLFPDPWPKRRHEVHRLLSKAFFVDAAAALAPGGQLRLITDDAPYFSTASAAGDACPALRRTEFPEDTARTITTFERRFRAEHKPIHFACWTQV